MSFYYKFIKTNDKILALMAILVLVQIFFIHSARRDYARQINLENIKPEHFRIQALLSENLMSVCSYESPQFIKGLNKKAKNFGINVTISTNTLLEIDGISFKKIYLVSKDILNPDLLYSTDGLIMSLNGKCYGLI
tara:strand:+ start:16733 stop:17140 length:408 start_codon:yes stop_codon:yes gene_type:complete